MGEVTRDIREWVESFGQELDGGSVPEVSLPTRTRSNIILDDESDVWVYGDRSSTRSGRSIRGTSRILKMLYTLEFIHDQVDQDRSSTLRELYYQSESWGELPQFSDQDESNETIEELEILLEMSREHFNLHPEESGASLVGDLSLRETTTRGSREIHCQRVGESGYTIPNDPDSIEWLEHDLDFVIAVETGGMRDRLVEEGFDEEYDCLIVHTKGQPARSTKRVMRRLNQELDLPLIVFCDGDPWSYRIFSSISYGSIKSAHLSESLATPDAQYLGVEPRDIRDYDLPSDPLSERDIQALENELEDPRFQSDYWQEQLRLQLELGQKSEQQSLASKSLDFVAVEYLPEKLDEMSII